MPAKRIAVVCRFLCGLGMAVLAAAKADGAEVTLRFASINQPNTRTFAEQLVPLKKAIETASNGRIAVDLRGVGQFGRPTELFGMVEKGEIEIAATVQGYTPGRFKQSTVMELPLLYDSAEAGTYAMWKLFEEGLLAKDYDSVKVLALYVLPPYAIMTAGADVTSIRALRGLRVRAPSLTVGLALSRLGAIPLGLPLDQIGTIMHEKLIDAMTYGMDSAMTTISDGKPLIDQVKVVVDAKFAAPALMIVMNKAAYDRLPDDLKAVIDSNTGRDFSIRTAAQRDKWEEEARAKLTADGHHKMRTVKPELRREFATRVAPMIDEWAATMKRDGIDGAKLLTRARALVREKSPSAS